MIPITLDRLAEVVGGRVTPDDAGTVRVTGPAFLDSRAPEPEGLFVALAGEHVDGHDYAASAVAGGAAAVLGSRPTDVPTVVVDDPVNALGVLARWLLETLREQGGPTVLALTGSQGKTGTKDYLGAVLGEVGNTVAPVGNANNELGVPITVLHAGPQTEFLVLEMGARGVGHIAYLCEIARPDVAAVLNVGTAHLGEFGSREAIARAKGEIVEALPADGVAVLNADDPVVAGMADRTRARVITFGEHAGDLRFGTITTDDLDRPTFDLIEGDVVTHVGLRTSGRHQVPNATAAATMARAAGVAGLDRIGAALAAATPASRWRMELTELGDGTLLINDAYNANPDSMRAAVGTLAGIGRSRSARTVAVLAEMRELGDGGDAEHLSVGEHVAQAGIDLLITVGEQARDIHDGAAGVDGWSGSARHAASKDEAVALMRDNVTAGDVVLVKGSRAAGLETVAEALTGGREGQTGARGTGHEGTVTT